MPTPLLQSEGKSPVQVVVAGAGIAGLSAALHLAERGVQTLVLEADPQFCGGRVAAGEMVEVGEWRFCQDHGVHAVWSPYRNLLAMLTRHQIRPMLVPAQEESWVYRRRGRIRRAAVGSAIRYSWLPAPFHYLNLFLRPDFLRALTLQDWLSLPLVWYGLAMAIGIDPLREDQPMEGWVLDDLMRGWSPALRAFFIGLARNGLSAQPNEIPLSGFIAFLRFYTLLRRDAWAFSYLPDDGGTSLVNPLVKRVQALDGTIALGTRVTHLEQAPVGWAVHWEQDGAHGRVRAEQVILATDAPATSRILGGSPGLAAEAGELFWPRGLGTAVVRIWFDRAPHVGPEAGVFSGDWTPDNFFWLHRIQDPYVRWHRATGGSALETHIYGPPELLSEPDRKLLLRTITDVEFAFPELRGHRIQQAIRRNSPAHTLFGLGPADRHLGTVTPWPGLFCCGDWVRHPSPAFFMERACVTGIAAANEVLAAHDLPTWSLLEGLPPESLAGGIERWMHAGRRILRRKKGR